MRAPPGPDPRISPWDRNSPSRISPRDRNSPSRIPRWAWSFAWIWLGLLVGAPVGWAQGIPILVEVSLEEGTFQASDITRGTEGATISAEVATGSPAFPTPRGDYSPNRLILNPRWKPGPFARASGAELMPASGTTPMGIAKIPMANGGTIALHGGATPLVLGKPVSLGCVRMRDADMAALISWLDGSGALAPPQPEPNGEIVRAFKRPVRISVR